MHANELTLTYKVRLVSFTCACKFKNQLQHFMIWLQDLIIRT